MNPELNELIEGYLNESLDSEEMAALNVRLAESQAARDEFRARCRVHGALAELFSDNRDFAFTPIETKPPSRRKWRAVISAAAALVAVFAGVAVFWSDQSEPPFARITNATDAVWEEPVRGEFLPNKSVNLERGLIELEIGEGVRVAIEGPAKFEVLGPKQIRLDRGSIAADVGEAGLGFTVITPDGETVDFGTRFGVRVDAAGRSETHVFEGEVEVAAGGRTLRLHQDEAAQFQQLLTLGAEPWTFPMPAHELPVDLGPDTFVNEIGVGMPTEAGVWSGDGSRVVSKSADGSIVPVRGSSMLQFLASYTSENSAAADQRASEVWRIVDLRPFSDRVNAGELTVKLGSSFNRLSDTSNSQFRLGIGAYRGRLEEAEEFWDRKNEPTSERLAATSSMILSDDNPATWEPLEISMPVPPGTEFLLIDLLAFENETDRNESEFEGHFADDVQLQLTSRARKSVPTAEWAGVEGNWKNDANWTDGIPDPALDRIAIRGEGEALIDSRVSTKQSVVIAVHNDSVGRLRIGPDGELVKSGFGQLIVGFNPGAKAEMIIQGSLVTRSPVFIGRNNTESSVDLAGGVWDAGDSAIRMSQYGGDKFPDTVSRLWVRQGGRLTARSLELIHDLATLEIDDGEVELETLLLGGEDGKAAVQLMAGELRVRRLIFGSGTGSFDFGSSRGTLCLEGAWTAESVLAVPNADWRVGGKPAAAGDFVIEHDGEFSKIQIQVRDSSK